MIDDDGCGYDGFESLMPTVDEFGVPSNILGPHPEEFFQMLGRIVALAAALESNLRVFCEYLAGLPQGALASSSFKDVIRTGLRQLDRLADHDDRSLAKDFLTRGEACVLKRHVYAHSLWPAQPGGQMYGWKRSRKKTAAAVDETGDDQTLDQMRADLAEFVALCEVPYWHRVLSLVSGGHHLYPETGSR